MKKRTLSSLVTAAVLGAIITACDRAPTSVEPLSTSPVFAAVPNPVFIPFAFPVLTCVELVDVSGTFHPNVKFNASANGNTMMRFHINAKGTGIGQTTGATYEWNDRLFDITNVAPDGAETFILNDNTRLIGHGSAENSYLTLKIMLTINANGDVSVDDFSAASQCVG